MHTPHEEERAHFRQDDEFAGVLVRQVQFDRRQADQKRAQIFDYERFLYHGVPSLRLQQESSGWLSPTGDYTPAIRNHHTAFAEGFCPTVSETTGDAGVETIKRSLARVRPLAGLPHCLATQLVTSGRHPDAALNFTESRHIDRDADGRVTATRMDLGWQPSLTLQSLTYDKYHRIASVCNAKEGCTRAGYDAATGDLATVSAPDGTQTTVANRAEISGQVTSLAFDQGSAVATYHFAYDGHERLAASWDDTAGLPASVLREQYTYAYASDTHPAQIGKLRQVDADTSLATRQLALATATGSPITDLVAGAQGWASDGLQQKDLASLIERSWRHAAPLGSVDDLTYDRLFTGAIPLGQVDSLATGQTLRQQSTPQQHRTRVLTESRALLGNHLVHDLALNGRLQDRLETSFAGDLVAREDALGARTAFSYDTQGRLRKLTLPDGTRHGVSYDAAGRVHQVQRDGLGTLDYTYVKGGKQPETMTLTDKKGQRVRQVHWLYDAMGRVVQRTHEAPGVSADTYTFRYDGKLADGTLVPGQRGRLSQVRGPGYRKTFRYDAAGLLSQQETAFDGWQTIVQDFTYFLDERVKRSHTRILAADGSLRQTQLLDYQLDSQARLQGTTLNGRPLYGVEYDALNRPAHVSLDAGAFAATLSYDPVTGAADGTYIETQDAAWSGSSSWSLNDDGRVDAERLAVDADTRQRSYAYDARGFLTGYDEDTQARVTYDHPAMGLPPTAQPHDDAGRRTHTDDGARLTYGPTGDIASVRRGSSTIDYLYDEAGHRLAKLEGGRFSVAYTAAGVVTDRDIVTAVTVNDHLLGALVNDQVQPLLADARGSVLAAPQFLDWTGPFGDRKTHPSIAHALDYVGRGFDADLGWIRMGQRDYSPKERRFTAPDPLFLAEPWRCVDSPDECNLYSYARNNPLSFVDPEGTRAQEVGQCKVSGNYESRIFQNAESPIRVESPGTYALRQYDRPVVPSVVQPFEVKFRFLPTKSRAMWIALFPLTNPTIWETEYLGGIDKSMWT